MTMVRIAPALDTRPNSENPDPVPFPVPQTIPEALPVADPVPAAPKQGSVVPMPVYEGVLVRFVICQLRFRLCRRSGPNRIVFARDAFQLNWQGPSTAPRGSSP